MGTEVREEEKRHLIRSLEHALESHHRRSGNPMIDGRRAGTVPDAYSATESKGGQEGFSEDVAYQETHEEHRAAGKDKDPPYIPETDIPEPHYLSEE